MARVALFPYIAALGLIVWLPASVAGRATGLVFRFARWFANEFDISRSLTYTVFEFGANIVLFVPFGLLLALAWPQLKGWMIVLLGYAASATIELGQTLLPSRYPTISDVIANTLGTAIGCLIIIAVRNAARSRTQPPSWMLVPASAPPPAQVASQSAPPTAPTAVRPD